MNLPNILTTVRMLLIPVFMIVFLQGGSSTSEWIAMIIFLVASFTDFLDGHLARKYDLVTNFGKIMDPLADKLLVLTALLCLISINRVPVWIVVIILARELGITGLRAVAAGENIIIQAAPLGKIKTVTQMLAISLLIIDINLGIFLLYIALILTVWSGIDYVVKLSRKITWM